MEEHPSDALKTKYSQPLTTYIRTSFKLRKIRNIPGVQSHGIEQSFQ